MLKGNLVKRIYLALILAIAIFSLITINRPSSAQSSLNLKSDIISLNSRINRLEQEVNRLRSLSSRSSNSTIANSQPSDKLSTPHRTITNPSVVSGEVIGRSDPLYERFATLLIELKEDVRSLESRIAELETVN